MFPFDDVIMVYWSTTRLVYIEDVHWDGNVVVVMKLSSLVHRKLSKWRLPVRAMAKITCINKISYTALKMNEDFLQEERATSFFLYDYSNQRKLFSYFTQGCYHPHEIIKEYVVLDSYALFFHMNGISIKVWLKQIKTGNKLLDFSQWCIRPRVTLGQWRNMVSH